MLARIAAPSICLIATQRKIVMLHNVLEKGKGYMLGINILSPTRYVKLTPCNNVMRPH